MDEHEMEKNKKVCGRRSQSSSMSKSKTSIPLHLTSEILSRLPAKSIARFRCVSKPWSSITTDPYFTNSFKTLSSTKPNLLLCFEEGDELFVFSIPQHESSHTISRYHMKFSKHGYFSITESVQGLICFEESGKPIVWNPSMGQFLTLPKPEMSWEKIKVFLGYDPTEGEHKVVCMPNAQPTLNECRVLTLGSAQKSWRSVNIMQMQFPRFTAFSNGNCINGVLYVQVNPNGGPFIIRFDVRSEKCDMIQLPFDDYHVVSLITYKGRLACVDDTMKDGLKLWILEDAEKKPEWWCKDFDAPFIHVDESSKTRLILKGITHAGEFIYAPNGFYDSFYILFRDPEGKSFRKVDFKGILDDDFRLTHALGNGRVRSIHTFPNHVETLMSF